MLKQHLFRPAYLNFSESTGKFDQEFLYCLKDRKITAKFSFWGRDAAKAWTDMLTEDEYKINDSETNTLNKNLANINKIIPEQEINAISLCCGILNREKSMLGEFVKHKKVVYVPIDSSIDIVNESLRMAGNLDHIEVFPFVSSLDALPDISSLIRKKHYSTSVFTLFCNVLGNYPQTEFLNNINKSMCNNDYLILGIQLIAEKGLSGKRNNEIKKIMNTYDNVTYLEFLFQFIARAGFKREDGQFEIEFSSDKLYPELCAIECYFGLKKDKDIQYLGEEIAYKKGERILVRSSYIYDLTAIKKILKENGFEIKNKFLSDDDDYAILVCKKI